MSGATPAIVDGGPEKQYEVSLFSSKRDNVPQYSLWTWAELCEEIRNPLIRREKDGPLFSPAKFNGNRAKANVERLSMLTLDLDHNAAFEPIKRGLAALSCKYVIYSTHSHFRKTESNRNAEPRYRVVIPLTESIPAKHFSALWSFTQKVTGLPIDQAAKDAGRMYYRPALASIEASYEYYVQEGEPLNWTSLPLFRGGACSIKAKSIEKTIIEGQRNPTLFKIAKKLFRQGLCLEDVEGALGKINNSRCSNPLEPSEIRSIAQNAEQYPICLPSWDDSNDEARRSRETQSDRVIRLVETLGAAFFHTNEGDAVATIPINSHYENHRIKSTFFREWICHNYWKAEEKVPSTKALQDAISALMGRARFGSPEEEIFVRLAEKNGRIYLDLANEKWQVIEISDVGWRTIEAADSPAKFRRPKGLLPLPIPQGGGCPRDLKNWINVSDEQFPLAAIWLIACFRTGRPFPVLILNGEQGSAKSTTSRVLRRMIDPNVSELRTAPRDERDLMIAANNGWILAYDNLSKIPDWLSDALCRISTGGGFATRTLYENDEETMFAVKRPLLLNGITELATRPDLLDRSLIINCPNISRSKRRDEETFWPRFEAVLPKLFGSLLTALSSTLKELPNVKLTEFERMADFEKFGVAAEASIGLPLGTFRQAYSANRRDAVEIALESSVTATLVLAFMNDRERWTGMATNLLGEMAEFAEQNPGLRIRRDDLPKGANVLSGELKKVSPTLRSNGIEFKRAKSGSRTIILQKTRKSSSESFQSSEAAIQRSLAEIETDDPPTMDDVADDKPGGQFPQRQLVKLPQTKSLDDVGDMDDRIRPSDP